MYPALASDYDKKQFIIGVLITSFINNERHFERHWGRGSTQEHFFFSGLPTKQPETYPHLHLNYNLLLQLDYIGYTEEINNTGHGKKTTELYKANKTPWSQVNMNEINLPVNMRAAVTAARQFIPVADCISSQFEKNRVWFIAQNGKPNELRYEIYDGYDYPYFSFIYKLVDNDSAYSIELNNFTVVMDNIGNEIFLCNAEREDYPNMNNLSKFLNEHRPSFVLGLKQIMIDIRSKYRKKTNA
ncbi:hypothetical protein Xmau_04338 [Xenorhabdus mauleonii]|uniref:Uncharacterized protein n=1 Tax=Xenorhabdus mauleonii TaxID=351675 RepID=A0A1I3XHY7_9GAMM|nr:hypothetical protein [Xenorhabdus mauleonii]PHM36194.1 hypothetical protein Xmau_04338 [Xenorhabdus mauleonii]SFK19070.1 hypothetical protein SAMN05421680_13518 [Xenorhabdus mauleonii]